MNTAARTANRSTLLIVGLALMSISLAVALTPLYGLYALGWSALGVVFIVAVHYPRFGLYTLVFLIPLQNLVVFEGGSTLVRVIGAIVFVAWLAHKLSKKERFRPVLTGPLGVPMLVFVTICSTSALWSDYRAWREAMFTIIQLVAMVFVLLDLIDSPKRLEQALLVLLSGSLINGGVAIYRFVSQYTTWAFYSRAHGGGGDANFSSSVSLVALPFLFLLMRRRSGWQRFVGLLGTAVSLSAIAIMASRTVILLVPVLLILQFMAISKLSSKMKFLFGIVLIFLVIAPLWPWGNIEFRFSEMMAGEEISVEYQGGRAWLAKWALGSFVENPILGLGLGRMKMRYDPIHNLFLEIAVQLGLPGLLSMAWIWLVAWRTLSKARRLASTLQNTEMFSLISAIRLSLSIYLLFSLTVSNERVRMLWLMFALAEICYRIVENLHSAEKERMPQAPQLLAAGDRRMSYSRHTGQAIIGSGY